MLAGEGGDEKAYGENRYAILPLIGSAIDALPCAAP
jgi:hypothetical protein